MLGVSGCVSRGSSCLLTRVLLCFINVSPPFTSMWGSSAGVLARLALTDLEAAQEDQTQTPTLFLLFLQTTCTRKHMHAHTHICTDVEPPSEPAAPCLALPCLLPSLLLPLTHNLLFCLCSHSDPQLQPQPSPLLPGTVVSRLPLGFPRVSPVLSAWRACRFQWCCRLGASAAWVPTGT